VEAVAELAAVRRRFGYRRLLVLVRRDGLVMNHKKFRLYRKRALGTRAPLAIPQGANQRWSLDFLSDAFADSRRFRILASSTTLRANAWFWSPIPYCPACGLRGARRRDRDPRSPGTIVSANGSERTSMAMLRWLQERQIAWHYIAPGKPQHHPSAQRSRQSHASDLRQPQRSRHTRGRDAALHQGRRAPSRCFTEPDRLKSIRNSARRWMKEGAQVTPGRTASRIGRGR
jgi:putative transposase